MHQSLKFALVTAAILLMACGGGGSSTETPAPPPPPPPPVMLIAGAAQLGSPSTADCADGTALGATLYSHPRGNTRAFTRLPDGNLLLAEEIDCDGHSSRIRIINPADNTIKTLVSNLTAAEFKADKPLTTFRAPAAIAVAPSGDIYVGDSLPLPSVVGIALADWPWREPYPGPGIWKLDAHGNMSMMAGLNLPMPQPSDANPSGSGVDGVGAAASFRSVDKICYGSNDLLYVSDGGQLRTVSSDGTVTTATNPAGVFRQTVEACGFGGSVLVHRWFDDSANDDYYDPIAQRSITKKPTPISDIHTNYWYPLLYSGSGNAFVLARQSDLSGNWLVSVNLVDGSSEPVAQLGFNSLTISPANLATTPPTIPDAIVGAVATSATAFDLLMWTGVIRFTRKP
jgi:hypothetical protein